MTVRAHSKASLRHRNRNSSSKNREAILTVATSRPQHHPKRIITSIRWYIDKIRPIINVILNFPNVNQLVARVIQWPMLLTAQRISKIVKKRQRMVHEPLKGVVVEILEVVWIFHGHLRTQRGRLPLKTLNSHKFCNFRKIEKILYLCNEFWSNLVFVEFYLLLDRWSYEPMKVIKLLLNDVSRM